MTPAPALNRPVIENVPEPDTQGRSTNIARIELQTNEPEQTLSDLVEYAAGLHVSDIFIYTNENNIEVAVRHLGIVRSLGRLPLDFGRRCISYVKTAGDMNFSERRRPLDGRWLHTRKSGQKLDLRINTIPSLYGEDCTLRILDQEYRLLSLDQLGLDSHHYSRLTQFLANPSGLLLVTGPTESGKSTTLYAALSQLNNGDRKINTIEDPIEYSLAGIRQSQVNPGLELGFDILLRHVLRQAPDVIMIGEIRDAETALTAVRAAGSGHLVLSTLHAPVAAAAVSALARLGVHPYLLSNALLGVIAQRLIRTLCTKCKEAYELPAPRLFEGVRQWLRPGEGNSLNGAVGCPACYQTGYGGRTGVFEMLTVTPTIRELIDNSAPVSAIRKKAVEEGMIEFRHAAVLKVAQGLTTIEEVVRVLPSEYLVP